ncbi:ACT domain-containing protein [Geomesophilobacter sediminis]|uniref:ACT domain-containing protein n=1 Tax=Geomesophilobacter sediminis TaxID=2798584 RepID=A0A8J7IVX9_9BACT|nr:hypothetical protein [Geomesophilobacter sediminis]MBJ6723452.1 hypothetical protein [Geomesophilobacter sediminis]
MVPTRSMKKPITAPNTPAPGETMVDIQPIAYRPSCYNLSLHGYLTPGWTGRLAAGLAENGIDIVRADAEKATNISWRSNFEITSGKPEQQILELNYLSLARKEHPLHQTAPKIALQDYRINPHREEGSIFVEIWAVDRTGFLRDLLDFFSLKCLFPVKMNIETIGETVEDRFWLKGVGGLPPSPAIAESLKQNLDNLSGFDCYAI